jgi:hypothetical protein
MATARRSRDSFYQTIKNPRLRDLVQGSPRNQLLARCEARAQRGIPIVWTGEAFRLKGLPSNRAEIPVVSARNGGLQPKPGWISTNDAEAIAMWRWRFHVARAA